MTENAESRATNEPNPQLSDDPVAIRRKQIVDWSNTAKRVGYLAMLIAVIIFAIGAISDFHTWVVWGVVIAISVSGLLLIPAIIFAYGATMAEREEAGEKFTY